MTAGEKGGKKEEKFFRKIPERNWDFLLETVWGAEISRKNLRRKAAEEKAGIGGPQKKK